MENPLEKNAVRNARKHTETKVFGLQTSTMTDTKFGDPKTEESLQSVKEAVPQEGFVQISPMAREQSWYIRGQPVLCRH